MKKNTEASETETVFVTQTGPTPKIEPNASIRVSQTGKAKTIKDAVDRSIEKFDSALRNLAK